MPPVRPEPGGQRIKSGLHHTQHHKESMLWKRDIFKEQRIKTKARATVRAQVRQKWNRNWAYAPLGSQWSSLKITTGKSHSTSTLGQNLKSDKFLQWLNNLPPKGARFSEPVGYSRVLVASGEEIHVPISTSCQSAQSVRCLNSCSLFDRANISWNQSVWEMNSVKSMCSIVRPRKNVIRIVSLKFELRTYGNRVHIAMSSLFYRLVNSYVLL